MRRHLQEFRGKSAEEFLPESAEAHQVLEQVAKAAEAEEETLAGPALAPGPPQSEPWRRNSITWENELLSKKSSGGFLWVKGAMALGGRLGRLPPKGHSSYVLLLVAIVQW